MSSQYRKIQLNNDDSGKYLITNEQLQHGQEYNRYTFKGEGAKTNTDKNSYPICEKGVTFVLEQ